MLSFGSGFRLSLMFSFGSGFRFSLMFSFGSGFRFSFKLSFVLFLSASFRVIVRFNGLRLCFDCQILIGFVVHFIHPWVVSLRGIGNHLYITDRQPD